MSKKELDRLGDRLRDARVPAEADLRQLESIRPHYLSALRSVHRVIEVDLSLPVAEREKNRDTIIEKLRREQDMRLSRMQDVVGARVVIEMTLAGQDELVARVAARFPDHQLRDRRTTPTHGYRAVHVIAKLDDLPVEIQVRTSLQHDWAQAMERMGDLWGKAVRYGGEPVDRERMAVIVPGAGPKPRWSWAALLKELSQHIAATEAAGASHASHVALPGVPEELTIRQLLDSFLSARL